MDNEQKTEVKKLFNTRLFILEEISRLGTCLESATSDEFVELLNDQNKACLKYFRDLVKEDRNRTNQRIWYLKNDKYKEKKKAYQQEYYLEHQPQKRERDKKYQQNQKTETYIEKMLTRRA